MKDVRIEQFLMLMLISLIVSLFLSYLYLTFYKNRATGSQIHRSFPLLGVSITSIFICIQFSLPLSLGLLGALSIVRFRTPIKEPEEIGFIMVVIAAAICCATFNLVFLGVLLVVTFVGLLLLNKGPRLFNKSLNDGVILVSLPAGAYKEQSQPILDFLKRHLPDGQLESVIENEDESVVSYSFSQFEQPMMLEVQDGLKSLSPQIKSNIFFNRGGDV
jgi:hypothetical protein